MRVILYGSSILIGGLTESLKTFPGLELMCLRHNSNELVEQAHRLQPRAVVAEAGALPDDVSMTLLREVADLLLIALDLERSRLLVLAGHHSPATTATDLMQVILG